MGQLRESKKQAVRQRISDTATALFFERGFDAVTVDEIALAAKVSKMTVFNYFSRKEDLLLDREDDLRLLPLRQALGAKPQDMSQADALRTIVRELHARKHPLCHIDAPTLDWWRVIDDSAPLKARLREFADEAMDALAIELGGPKPDGTARLMAGIVVLTLRVAREEAIRLMRAGASARKSNAALLERMEQGLSALDRLASGQGQAGSRG